MNRVFRGVAAFSLMAGLMGCNASVKEQPASKDSKAQDEASKKEMDAQMEQMQKMQQGAEQRPEGN